MWGFFWLVGVFFHLPGKRGETSNSFCVPSLSGTAKLSFHTQVTLCLLRLVSTRVAFTAAKPDRRSLHTQLGKHSQVWNAAYAGGQVEEPLA